MERLEKKIVDMHRNGLSTTEIAEVLHIEGHRVCEILHDAGEH